jgi:hypothetical protein
MSLAALSAFFGSKAIGPQPQCQGAGGQECTSDEVTNDNLCIVSVADDGNDVVVGGAGVTVEAARDDAFARAAVNGTPLGPTAAIVISDCH